MATCLFTIQEVSTNVRRCPASIYNDIKKGVFPPPVKIGSRTSRWREEDINEWIANLPIANLAEATTEN